MNFFELIEPYYAIWTVSVVLFGACFGSFLNVVIWRIPLGESIVVVPSHCPKCNHKITPWENIPVVSWLSLRGKCSSCNSPISPRYIFVEALTAIIWLTIWMQAWRFWQLHQMNSAMPYWPIALVAAYLILLTTLIALSFIDIDHKIIPDSIIIFSTIVALVLALGWPASHEFLSAPNSMDSIGHKPVLAYLLNTIPKLQVILTSARGISALDCTLGILFGGGFLWAISWLGKLLHGKKSFKEDEPAVFTVTDEGYMTDEDGLTRWDDTFIRDNDTLSLTGVFEGIELKTTSTATLPEDYVFEGTLLITEEGVVIADQTVPLDDIKELTIRVSEWTMPLEPMGMGDATLMAMIGAFLGPGSVIMILCLASILGSVFGILGVCVRKGKMHNAIPFGPYIAIATFFYILFDDQVLTIWVRLLQMLYPI